jgi:protein-L-isoaspartate(D-aspartate) O-methyltransferase
LHNVVVRHGDGLKGWPEQAPFDRIVLSAAVPEVPQNLIDQLKPGGVLIAPVAHPGAAERFSQHLVKIMQTEGGRVEEPLMPVVFVPMVPGLPQESRKLDGASGGTR